MLNLKKDAITKFKDESDLKKFLDNLVNFNNYSYNNLLLIFLQRPDAKYVSSFKNYSDMGYKINKGAKGIKIFIPNFYNMVKIKSDDNHFITKPYSSLSNDEKKIYKDSNDDRIVFFKQVLSGFSLGHVFDAKDTSMPLSDIENELSPVLSFQDASNIKDCFIKAIYNDGFKVKYKELPNNTKGYCDLNNQEITIGKNLNDSMQLKVLIHEYAHALAHKHLQGRTQDYQEHRNKYETEAESIAYTVSKYLGMDTSKYSLSYLYSWSKNKNFQEVDDSFNTIVNYSKKVINNFEKFYEQKFGLYADEYRSMTI